LLLQLQLSRGMRQQLRQELSQRELSLIKKSVERHF
jgi:hypothetical protein